MSTSSTIPRRFFLLICLASAQQSAADVCLTPERPFLPSSQADMRAYADLLRADFEDYIAQIQQYLRCLDAERARAIVETHEVVANYARLVSVSDDIR